MKPTQLTIQNYRSLVDCTLPLRDLTIIIGPNGAGKAALLEVFQLLRRGCLQELAKFMGAQGGFHALLNHRKGDYIGIAMVGGMNPPAYRLKALYQRARPKPRKYVKTTEMYTILKNKYLAFAADRCPEFKAFLNTLLTLSDLEPLP